VARPAVIGLAGGGQTPKLQVVCHGPHLLRPDADEPTSPDVTAQWNIRPPVPGRLGLRGHESR
jgi:hypothetical protein